MLVALVTILFFWIIARRGREEKAWLKLTQEHFAAVVGLPTAAVGALFLVLIVRVTEGPMTIKLGSVAFEGASAPIVFWVVCFLAMTWAIKTLWNAGP